MADHMLPELTLEMIDAFFSPFDHEMPHVDMMKMNTLGVSGMGGYTWDMEKQRPVYNVAGQGDDYTPPYKRHTTDSMHNKQYAEDIKRTDDDEFKRSQRDGPGVGGGSTRDGSLGSLSSKLDTLTISSASARGAVGAAAPGGDGDAQPKSAVFQKNRDPNEFYNQPFFKKNHRYQQLPIVEHRESIVNTIEGNSVVLIKGSTGSGKTTQVPQFILDDASEKRRPCNIIVTQPRKIAARSVADRVCQERNWQLGSICGYQVGMDKKMSDDTCILYCTAGILLQKIVNDKSLNEFTHVVLDEIHERQADLDFCLLVVKKLQRTVSGQVKIVLMSATMDTQVFSDYFTQYMAGDLHPCPVLDVEGRMFDVSEYYSDQLEQLAEKRVEHPDFGEPVLNEDYCHVAVKLIAKFEDMERKEEDTRRRNRELNKKHGHRDSHGNLDSSDSSLPPGDDHFRGSVLVFLPGLAELNSFYNILNEHHELNTPMLERKNSEGEKIQFKPKLEEKYQVTLLHSNLTLTKEEQKDIFRRPRVKGTRKVILSTNIAESSITVPDVRYVIDFCLTKNLFCDTNTSYPSLRTEWASKSSCDQRRGRAGRVSNGRCYRMVPQQFFNELDQHAQPEMQRAPLNTLVLRAKTLDMGSPKQLLGLAISPPNLDDIERTILLLKEVGALINEPVLKNARLPYNPRFDGKLTFTGRVMSSLPLDVHLTKLILLGHVFGVLEEAIIMAAALNLGGFFSRPFRKDIDAFMAQLSWTHESNSDVIGLLNAYRMYSDARNREVLDGPNLHKWGKEHFINVMRIVEVEKLVGELQDQLDKSFNIKPSPKRLDFHDSEREYRIENLLKFIIAGAFYPNYFLRQAKDERDSLRELCGLDPFTTVMLSGVPAEHGPLYKDKINAIFERHMTTAKCETKFHFEGTKIFVEFVPSAGVFYRTRIPPHVYLALKMARIGVRFEFDAIPKEEAIFKLERMKKLQEEAAKNEHRLRSNRVMSSRENNAQDFGGHTISDGGRFRNFPSVLTQEMEIVVTSVISLDHYYGIYGDDDTFKLICDVAKTLNNPWLSTPFKKEDINELKIGYYVAAPTKFPIRVSEEDVQFHRARITQIQWGSYEDEKGQILPCVEYVRVFFVDCGKSEVVHPRDLRHLDNRVVQQCPFQAFEIKLAKIRPHINKYPSGQWSEYTVTNFIDKVMGHTMTVNIYSIVDNVIRCDEMIDTTFSKGKKSRNKVSVIEQLIFHELAEAVEEPLVSRLKHDERERERSHRLHSNLNRMEAGEDGAYGCDQEIDDDDVEENEKKKLKKKSSVCRRENDWQVLPLDNRDNQRRGLGGGTMGPAYGPNQRGGKGGSGKGGRHSFHQIRLHGPMNPLVLSFRSLNASTTFKACSIAQESVNSICLDDHPGDMHDRLLVAATIGMHTSGNSLAPRDTTLLPMVPGMAHVLPLIFAPQVEFRTNARHSHLTGALLGLGFNHAVEQRDISIEEGPIFPDHDMEMTFDAEIAVKDVMGINRLRAIISKMLEGGGQNRLGRSLEDTVKMQAVARQRLFNVVDERRKSLRLTDEERKAGGRLVKERMIDFHRPNKWNLALEDLVVPYDEPISDEQRKQQEGWILPLLSVIWTELDQLSGSTRSTYDSETASSTSDVDTESVSSSNTATGDDAAASPRPVVRLTDNGSVSGFSIHSSEYASSDKSLNPRKMTQLVDLKRHDEELRRRVADNDGDSYPCKLCGVQLPDLRAIKAHLLEDNHRQRATRLSELLAEADTDVVA